MFKNWLIDRSLFLPDRLILETDFPYLSARNLHGSYNPSCALLATAEYLSKTIDDPNQNALLYLQFSNRNLETMYAL